MVKDGLFKAFTRTTNRKKLKENFLIQLDNDASSYYRRKAKAKKKDANKYVAEILTQAYHNEAI
tara:strand:- start:755 stop:946 length:192 start_codon:yes stop_codon:yes gene_type:complete